MVDIVKVGMMGVAVMAKAEAEADIDLYHLGSSFPFPTFIETLRIMFGSSVEEELYCFPFYYFLVRFTIFLFIYFNWDFTTF